MKKQIITVLLLTIALLLLTSCQPNIFNSDDAGEKATLKIDGIDINSENSKLWSLGSEHQEFLISLVDVLCHYGFEFEWESDTVAKVKKGDATYVLNTAEPSLSQVGSSENLFADFKAPVYYCLSADKDVVLCTSSLESVMKELGFELYVRDFTNFGNRVKNKELAYIVTRLTVEQGKETNLVFNGVKMNIDGTFKSDECGGATMYPLIKLLGLCGFEIKESDNTHFVVKQASKSIIISLDEAQVKYNGEIVDYDYFSLSGDGSQKHLYDSFEVRDGDLYCSSYYIRCLIDQVFCATYFFDCEEATYIIMDK